MLGILLTILILLWILGSVRVNGLVLPDFVLFSINQRPITLLNILTLIIVSWIIGILPRPFREIGAVLAILWVLSTLGVISITGLPSLLLIAIIVGLVLYMLAGASDL